METGPNVTQFLQVSITLGRFLVAPSVLSNPGSRKRRTVPQHEERQRVRRTNTGIVSQINHAWSS